VQFCPIVISCQRLAGDDLPGYVKKTYPANMIIEIKFPALVDPETGKASSADNAVSRIPETVPTLDLLQLRSTRIGRFVLASQYQQEPVALGGNLIPVESFHRYDPSAALGMKWDRLIIPVDTAFKIKQANDFSALALWGLHQRKAYLIDLLHGKWESPELLTNAIAFWKKWGAIEGWPRPRMIIEEKAAGTPLLQNLNRQSVPAIGIERDIDKVRRVQNILCWIETGMVVIPKDNSVPWIDKFVTEHAEFSADGKHAHDDMVDTTVDGIEGLLGKPLSIFDVLTGAKR
jgi:predicted phage terminase large subunit-like protein